MRLTALAVLVVLASNAGAYTGCCFLDAILNGLDALADAVVSIFDPTTTTTSTSTTTSSTTTSSTTTTTTVVTYTTTSTTSTSTTTTTTLSRGECEDKTDCPQDEEYYTCNFEGDVVRNTRVFFCANPGQQTSRCKSRQTSRVHDICGQNQACVEGRESCIEE